MEEVEKVSKALQLVERYEYYLFRKAGGFIFINWGIIIPLFAFIALKAQQIADVLGMSAKAFLLVASTMIWVVGIVITVYLDVSAMIVASRMRETPFHKHIPHMVAILLIWFISFFLINFVPKRFKAVSWLWAASCASILTYVVIRKVSAHGSYPELLFIGLILLVTSLPITSVNDVELAQIATLVTFTISFVTGGLYSIKTASKVLIDSELRF
ncbi:MAG: hypothetical protein ACFFCW_03815 [Candidatus Hodarchaeota archaeon]